MCEVNDMKAKQINDTTLKITISMNDLEERGMELADFLMPQEKTEDFFYTVLDEVDLPDHFKASGMLSFRVTPKQDRVDIFVTKSDLATDFNMEDLSRLEEVARMSPEDFFKNLEESMTAQGDQEALQRLADAEAEDVEETESDDVLDYVHYVLAFDNLNQVVTFAQTVDYPVEAAELYKYQGGYQLTVLFYVEGKPSSYPNQIYARLLEHAKESQHTRAYLREHAILLREGHVLTELAGVRD